MYSFLLVDDETFVLNGLKKLIQALTNQVDEIHLAGSGERALEILRSRPIDVVFTDIKMPHMDGMELIEQIVRYSPACKIIILSGYSDFDIAQRAIANNIRYYLLKPVTRAKLEEALEKILDEFQQEQRHHHYVEQLERQLLQNIPLMREKFLMDLAGGIYQRDMALFLQIERENYFYQILLVAIDSFPDERYSPVGDEKKGQLALLETLDRIQGHWGDGGGYIAFTFQQRICLLLMDETPPDNNRLEAFIQQFQNGLSDGAGIVVSAGISNSFQRFADFSQYLQQAQIALRHNKYSGIKRLVFYGNVAGGQEGFVHPDITLSIQALHKALSAQDRAQAVGILDKLHAHAVRQYSDVVLYAKPLAMEILASLSMYAYEQKLVCDISLLLACNPYEAILLADEADAIFDTIYRALQCLLECIQKKDASRTSSTVEQIKAYVSENISEDITLEALSNVVYLTPHYISYIFKKETGVSFKDFVLEEKIRHAKALLQGSRLKIYEVAQAVGYRSVPYFSKVFKKQTGIYPTDFRQDTKLNLDRDEEVL